ncbi:hypothetical protein GCK32_019978, partial [Trichostrongylus colubriformis]
MVLFHKNEAEIRRQLVFNREFQQAASQELAKLQIRDRHFAMCVHIGQRISLQQTTDHSIHDVAKAARSLAIGMNLTSFYIFADRSEFAEALEVTLRINVKWQPN